MAAQQRFDRVIAISLQTSGPNPYRDRIVAIQAVAAEGETPRASFAGCIDTGTSPSLQTLKQGTLGADVLGDPRPQDEVMAALLAFVPDEAVCIAHGASVIQAFLRRASRDLWTFPMLDSLVLSQLCFPNLPSHDLLFLARLFELGGSGEGASRSDDAQTTAQLWLFLHDHLRSMPAPLLRAVAEVTRAFRKDPLSTLIRQTLSEHDDPGGGLLELFPEKSFPRRRAEPEPESFEPLDTQQVASVLDPEGRLSSVLPSYEYREEQIRMVEAVTAAFNESRHLLVEAGTGVGKSLGYLVPAVLYSLVNNTAVVVSTNTKNLQAQLYLKDLPLISRILDASFKTALIKGRRNYLCIRKMLYLLQHIETELERDERLPLARALCWAAHTETGDLAEGLIGEPGRLSELARRLGSVAEECSGKECRFRQRCFLQRARRRALAADVVVANHAVVFSEMGNPAASPVLPPHHQLIMDEAHNLESAITGAMSREVSSLRIRFVLKRLCRKGKRRRLRGLVPSLTKKLESEGDRGDDCRGLLLEKCDVLAAMILGVEELLLPFFHALSGLLKQGGQGETRRIFADRKLPRLWDPIDKAQKKLLAALGAIAIELNATTELMADLKNASDELAEFARELRANALWIREFTEDTELVLGAEDKGYVYWVEPAAPDQGGARAWGAPVDVGPLMNEHLYSTKRSVVFTSATLTVMGSPDFIKGRLGINLIPGERLKELFLGTVFDYERQCVVLVPTFLPEPGERNRNYAEELGAFLVDLFRCTAGRGMALFTSYDMLSKSAAVVTEELEGSPIRVLTQGMSGSRENITRIFAADVQSVLLGTHSFWEGVDVSGESLSCLVLARLPFAVHTDPIVAARCEAIEAEGQNPFLGYSLPGAVIRFRQGFGRLIRHRTDRGVIVIADRRIVTKRYGSWFRGSIPAQVYTCADPGILMDAVNDVLDQPSGPD